MTEQAKWWTEDRRGQTMGYGIRWGSKWGHITRITDDGPGANGISALCGGIQSVCLVHSGLDLDNQAECEDWKHEGIRIPLNCRVEDAITWPRLLAEICPKCKAIHDRKHNP